MKPPARTASWRTLCLILASAWALTGCDLVLESVTHFCAYSEFVLPTPVEMAGAEFTVEKDAVQGVGRDSNYSCLKYMGAIEHQIAGNALSETERSWYRAQGVQSVPLRRGTHFEWVKWVALVKYGLGTIDSGKGPLYFLVLKDDSGALLYASLGSLGSNPDDRFLSMKLPGSEPILINYTNFEPGKDVDHPRIQLRKMEPKKQDLVGNAAPPNPYRKSPGGLNQGPATYTTIPLGARPAPPTPP